MVLRLDLGVRSLRCHSDDPRAPLWAEAPESDEAVRVRPGSLLGALPVSGQPDPKPVKRKRKATRVIDRQATTRAVLAQDRCSCCPSRSATGHHVLAKGQGGDDVDANIVAVCGSGTTGCHGKIEGADRETRAILGRFLLSERPDTLEYLSGKLGPSAALEWLRRHLHVEVASWPVGSKP